MVLVDLSQAAVVLGPFRLTLATVHADKPCMRWWIAPAIIFGGLAILAIGETRWLSWESTAGEENTTVVQWPAESAIARSEASRTVLIFIHPYCEHIKMSLNILEQVAANLPESASWLIVASRPPGSDWKPETTLPIYFDEGGVETKRFGVTTPGHLLLFDGEGSVLYSGGVTDFRSGSEENDGVRLLEASLPHGPAALQ